MKLNLRIAIVLAFPASALSTGAASAQSPTTERISVATGGTQGYDGSEHPAISADGRFVAFESAAWNLVGSDTNGIPDVFVRDRMTSMTERVSVSTTGAEMNGTNTYGHSPAISADGRFVVFESDATNLVSGDTNGTLDVFVHDRQNGVTERVSVATGGAEGDSHSRFPSISADGRLVAFWSSASNLVAGDTNGVPDEFVRDRMIGVTERVSLDSAGVQGNDACDPRPSISADGRIVAFSSKAANLVAGDTNGSNDVFVRDRTALTTERVSVDSSGLEGSGASIMASASTDGRFVAFMSFASNLVAADTNALPDVFVRDRLSGITERVSVATGGMQENGSAYWVSIASNLSVIAFDSYASNLVAGDTNGFQDAFVHDRATGITERVSIDSAGAEGTWHSSNPSISADGRYVAFQSLAPNLVAGDTNVNWDVFVRDRGPQTPPVYCSSGTTSNGCAASISASSNPSVSFAHTCSITVTSVEGLKAGILFYGTDNSSFVPAPWAPGSASFLCVKRPTQRAPMQNSGGAFNACDGAYLLDWNAYQASHPLALGNPWSIGDRVYVQAWFRDPLAVKSTNLSNAVVMTYGP